LILYVMRYLTLILLILCISTDLFCNAGLWC
jgi:hypothetical protein